MMVSIVMLKNQLSRLLSRAGKGEEIIVTDHGHPFVRLSAADDASAFAVRERISRGASPLSMRSKTKVTEKDIAALEAEFLSERRRDRHR